MNDSRILGIGQAHRAAVSRFPVVVPVITGGHLLFRLAVELPELFGQVHLLEIGFNLFVIRPHSPRHRSHAPRIAQGGSVLA